MVWQIMMIVVASNLDDLGVGFSLGIKRRIPWHVIWIISVLSGVTMALGLLIGEEIAFILPGNIDIYFASLIFIFIGLWFIWQGVTNNGGEKLAENLQFDWKASILLGLALGVDSFAAGVSGGLHGFPILLTSVLAWLTSFLFIWFGSQFGRVIAIRIIREYADYFSGGMFIFLAIIILIF
ncbi:manganese efflux pump MntP family protein [Salipaludibacillus daqingensis]|uniref:manganese efflux pump MntP n=1 Tax=Salipaludibacillus daqingensis TaxID=3041001 RepID=UPI002473BFB4|nr:manganese efflux pump [Salipaludibacillus daqingensis]